MNIISEVLLDKERLVELIMDCFWFGLMLNVLVNKFSVMLGGSHRYLDITITFGGKGLMILVCSFTVLRGLLQLDESMVLDIENLSRNMLFSSSKAQ